MTEIADPIAEGRSAWQRIREHGRRSWDDWVCIARALAIGRSEAMARAKTNKPLGATYVRIFGAWLREHGLDEIDNQQRYRAILCLENEIAIEKWRATLTDKQRGRWNHPGAVWAHWKRSTKAGAAPRREAVKSARKGCGKAIHWPGDALRRAAIAIREARTNDVIMMAKAALQAAIRDETDLLMLLPEKPMPPRSRPMPAAVDLHAPA
jgi:hypothetical protein